MCCNRHLWSFTCLFSFDYGQDLSCIKDLTSLYEAATIDDVYIAYDQLKVDADSLYTCIGIAGAQAGEESIGEKFQITNCFFGFI